MFMKLDAEIVLNHHWMNKWINSWELAVSFKSVISTCNGHSKIYDYIKDKINTLDFFLTKILFKLETHHINKI